ncbi:Maff2 family mobile element protein [Peptoniphilaceae bacterium SGI.131]
MGELFDSMQKYIEMFGIALAVFGAFRYFEGYSDQNSAAQNNGFKQIVGGIGIYAIAAIGIGLIKARL